MFYELSLPGVILRFYLMMLIVVIAGFVGQWWLALLSLPILVSILAGYKIGRQKKVENAGKMVQMEKEAGKKAS